MFASPGSSLICCVILGSAGKDVEKSESLCADGKIVN